MGWLQSQIKLFRTLLFCYPAEFRHEYGSEMEHVFASRLKREPRWRLWLETVVDIACTAPKEHWHVLVSDVRYGARSLAQTPGFTAVALLVMALGIGSTIAIFSLVNAVLLRSLPYGEPKSLVYLWSPVTAIKGLPRELGPNLPDVLEWRRRSHSFDAITIFHQGAVTAQRGNASVQRVGAAFVDENFFRTFQVWPEFGRALEANDNQPGHDHVVVISHQFWRSQFGAARNVIGRHINLNRKSYTVVGVMPKDFGYPFDGDVPYDRTGFKHADLWLPAVYSPKQQVDRVNFISALAVGRLRAGISVERAQAELKAIEAQLQPLYPEMWRGWGVYVKSLVDTIVGPVERLLWLLLGAVTVVLVIAISNVASLLLARATRRAHELGIRTALGAERMRLVRQLLTESLLVSFTGTAIGVALAYVAVKILTTMNPGNIPRFDTAHVDGRALLAALLLAFVTGLIAGSVPAVAASRSDVLNLLRQGGARLTGGSTRIRESLIVLEIALSLTLLAAAGLLIRSYLRVASVDTGFSSSTVTFQLGFDDRYGQPQQRSTLTKKLLSRLTTLPSVREAGASSATPLTESESVTSVEIRGLGYHPDMIEVRSVTPSWRKALGTSLLLGRDLGAGDVHTNSPVVLVNRQFARKYLQGHDPLASQLRLGIGDLSKDRWSTIVGVIGDVRNRSVEETGMPQVFQPADAGDNFAISYSGSAKSTVAQVRAVLQSIDGGVTLENVHTMAERVTASNARRRFQTVLLTWFAVVAVTLVLAGLYGLMSYTVKQRTAEIAIRLAVGSPRRLVVLVVLKQGLRLTVLGLAIGLSVSLAYTRLLSSWLYGVKATDPFTFAVAPVFILIVTGAASLIPAWMATRINPAEALKVQ